MSCTIINLLPLFQSFTRIFCHFLVWYYPCVFLCFATRCKFYNFPPSLLLDSFAPKKRIFTYLFSLSLSLSAHKNKLGKRKNKFSDFLKTSLTLGKVNHFNESGRMRNKAAAKIGLSTVLKVLRFFFSMMMLNQELGGSAAK
mmetsp:Transcript_26375/g.30231  ORF Transcript_26375/g.30231 Transcript_26375/m.30231 type:complete len:142 (+) Transcript_26375:587-1012(+)